MFSSSENYGREVLIMCDYRIDSPATSYSGFVVVRVDDDIEIARFYEGDPIVDYETAIAYAQSIASRINKSPLIEKLWKKLGSRPREVRRNA